MNINSNNKVLVAKVLSTKGLKGEVKIKSFMVDFNSLLLYPLFDEAFKMYEIQSIKEQGNALVAKFKGIENIDQAKLITMKDLYVNRENLPDVADDEYYHVDLIGLNVLSLDEEIIGTVVAVHNFGAGDIIEIKQVNGNSVMVNFNKATVPELNLKKGFLKVIVKDYEE